MIDISAISTCLTLGKDDIWYSADEQKIFYPTEGNDACFAIEDNSFWFRHRNACITTIANIYSPKGAIFDVGGGNGYVAQGLSEAGFAVVLVEPGKDGARHAKERGIQHVICATVEAAGFKPHALPAVGMFDVLEHIEDDRHFLQHIHSVMQQGGYLYLTVPAYTLLWSADDVFAGHFRRYSLKALAHTLHGAGFQVIFATYIFRFLPLPVFLFRTLPYRLGLARSTGQAKIISRDHAVGNKTLATFLNTLLQSELKNLQKQQTMHFGGSCLVVAQNL